MADKYECAARKQALPEPAECNWPFCACDPHAEKVIEALQESGYVGPLEHAAALTEMTALRERNAKLRRGLEWIAEHGEADMNPNLDDEAESFGLDADEFVRMAHDNLIIHAQQVLASDQLLQKAEGE